VLVSGRTSEWKGVGEWAGKEERRPGKGGRWVGGVANWTLATFMSPPLALG